MQATPRVGKNITKEETKLGLEACPLNMHGLKAHGVSAVFRTSHESLLKCRRSLGSALCQSGARAPIVHMYAAQAPPEGGSDTGAQEELNLGEYFNSSKTLEILDHKHLFVRHNKRGFQCWPRKLRQVRNTQ